MESIARCIRAIPDFPKPGILFRDVTPLLNDPEAFRAALALFEARYRDLGIQRIVAIEARGFLFGAPLADRLGVGLAIVRKPGKLPYRCVSETYALEYGHDTIQMHVDAVQPGERVLIVDDLLATGGTAAAAVRLVRSLGADVVECAFVVELAGLNGRAALGATPAHVLLSYPGA